MSPVLLTEYVPADPFEPFLWELHSRLDCHIACAHDDLPDIIEAMDGVSAYQHEFFLLRDEFYAGLGEGGKGAVESGVVACSEDCLQMG